MSLSAIVFDFDGVLADSEPLHLKAYQDVLGAAGVTLTRERYYDVYLGYDDVGVFEAVARDFRLNLSPGGVRELIDRKSRRLETLVGETDVLFEGAAACVERLTAAAPLAVASGALRHEIELILRRAGLLQRFRAIVAAGETPRSKPAPDPYSRALALVGADPAGAVAIEDSRWGIESARAAGMAVVGLTTTYDARELQAADLVVASLADVTQERLEALVGAPRR
jgi:beta-phosphoglucomutase